jgi:hypothetical protein
MFGPPSVHPPFRHVILVLPALTAWLVGCDLEQGGLGVDPVVVKPDASVRPPPSYPPPPAFPPAPDPGAPEPVPTAPDAAAPAPDGGPAPAQSADAGPPPADGASALPPSSAPPAPASPPTPANFCSGNQLLVCLPFDGNTNDLGPARRETTAAGVTFEPGLRGQAARFGPGRQVEVRETFPVFDRILSVELQVRPMSHPPGNRRAGLVHSPDQYGVFLLGNDGDVECRTPNANAIARRAVPINTWTRVLCIFDEEDVELYVNGRSVADGRSFQRLAARGSGSTRIGDTDLDGGPLLGLIDDLRIWRGRRNPRASD